MTSRQFEASRLDIASLGNVTDLGIDTIRKADLKKLAGLDELSLRHLALRWLSAADLTDVPLPPGLEAIRIWHSNKLKSLDGIGRAQALREVALRENGQPLDISALADLPNLRVLSIEGGYGAGQKLVSLAPLEGMQIEELSMQAIDGANLDLGPIARLPKLRKLDLVGQNFAPEALAEVAAAKPWFFEQLMTLQPAGSWAGRCKTCKGVQVELFLKGKKHLWCPDCQAGPLEKALDGFRDMVKAAAARASA